jgi:hypothetical protein
MAQMAMVPIPPFQVDVTCDPFDGRPRSVRVGAERLPILAVASVREEASAYPLATGPRTIFEIQTPGSRLTLTFHHRPRRWVVEGLDPDLPASRAA